jgi:hypothetical protein
MFRTRLYSIAISTILIVSLHGFGASEPEPPQLDTGIPAVTEIAPAKPTAKPSLLEASRLPEATQIYLKSPATLDGIFSGPWVDRVLDTPLGEYLMQQLVNELGELPALARRDILPYVKGNLSIALVRAGGDSIFERLFKLSSQEAAYFELRRQIGFLGKEVAQFHTKFGRLPKNWEEMVTKSVRKSAPSSEVAKFVILGDSQNWTVTAIYEKAAGLESYATPPAYSSKLGLTQLPSPTTVSHLVISFESNSVEKLSEALNSGAAQRNGVTHTDPLRWKLKLDGSVPWHLTLKNSQVFISDDEELLADFSENITAGSSSKKASRLSDNRRFQEQLEQLGQPGPDDRFAFIDLKDLASSTPSLRTAGLNLEPFESAGFISHRLFNNGSPLPYQVSSQAFLQTANGLTTPAGAPDNLPPAPTWDFVSSLPAQSSIAYAWETNELTRVLRLLGDSYPDLAEIGSTFTTQLQQSLGPNYKADDVYKSVGWIASENEFFSRIFQLTMQLWLGTGPWGGTDGTVSSFIQTLAGAITIELKDSSMTSPIIDKLVQDLPLLQSPTTLGKSRYWSNRENTFIVAQLPNRVMASSRSTRQILYRGIEVQNGFGQRILDEPSWVDFMGNVNGRPLCFLHEKVDGPCSILKGLLLVFDSNTRQEAEALGNYRDGYFAGTVQATGFHFYVGLYSAVQGTPITRKTPPPEEVNRLLESLKKVFQAPMPTPKRKR